MEGQDQCIALWDTASCSARFVMWLFWVSHVHGNVHNIHIAEMVVVKVVVVLYVGVLLNITLGSCTTLNSATVMKKQKVIQEVTVETITSLTLISLFLFEAMSPFDTY